MDAYIQIDINIENQQQGELLIAELSGIGFDGFLEEEGLLKAFIPKSHYQQEDLIFLLNKYTLTHLLSIVDSQNWNALWESNFDPVLVDDFVGIRANFHTPLVGFEYELVITPKMSFGTGHHGTTFSVMRLMRNIDCTGKRVFDFGTGTGILAILAEKLGAAKVLAVDNDSWCIENASENILVNNCNYIDIELLSVVSVDQKYDIVIANINRHIIEANLSALSTVVEHNGILVLSGLLESDEMDIIDACISLGFIHQKTLQKDGWVAIQFLKSTRSEY
ncbi:MAG: 50S ribosomal protein L11 methyltransferase [Sphingobacteriia bacterium]|nr:MAG: 50S ribosomal protein L11 methyltransferase [Sphingobacteriia bacterium]TAG30519.1 MAG: 50S ribosomal protein L11 methyltransferase [Sphingobacteriia bacterium]